MTTLQELQALAKRIYPDTAITLPHILCVWASLNPDGELDELLKGSGLDASSLVEAMEPFLLDPDVEDRNVLLRTISSVHSGDVYASHILKKLCETPHHRITRGLIGKGMNCKTVLKNIHGTKKEPQTLFASLGIKVDTSATPLLRYGRDLTALAANGAFAELCARPQEMNRLTDILLRKRKGNPVLTGPAGVGKTALVELLAQESVANPSSPLAGYRIFELSIGKLVAGTRYRGDFEERFESVMKAIMDVAPALLFIDEMHLLLGSGRAEGAPMDGANLMKPYIARDNFRVIGATTSAEYQHYIARDEALARRFQEVKLTEPEPEILLAMVRQQARVLARHHGIEISDTVIQKAIELTNRHVLNRHQPDKTVDLLDTALVSVRRKDGRTLDRDGLLETLSAMMNTPIHTLTGQDKAMLKNLASTLKKRVIGQDHAIDMVTQSMIHRRMDMGNPDRPLGIYLFAGDTGVGKTELARAIASSFFGDERRLVHIDLGEYADHTSIHKLIGAPYGYVGCDEEGILIRGLQTHPSCLILFDEMEKANPEIHRLLLGLLDNGRITNGRGERFDARQCIIIMTTNAITSQDLEKLTLGFGRNEKGKADPYELLSKVFPKEFLGRIDEIIPFNRLSRKDMKKIMKMRIDEAVARLGTKGIVLEYEEERLIDHLLERLEREHGGARALARIMEKLLLQPLAMALLEAGNGKDIAVTLNDEFYKTGEVFFEKTVQ